LFSLIFLFPLFVLSERSINANCSKSQVIRLTSKIL